MRKKLRIAFWVSLFLAFAIPPLVQRYRGGGKRISYMEPRYPGVDNPSEERLNEMADFIAHQRSGNTRLGTIISGQKTLIVTDANQDMRLLEAVIKAMNRRGIEVDYIFEKNLFKQTTGVEVEPPRGRGQTPVNWEYGWLNAIWPRLLPESLRQEVMQQGAQDRWRAAAAGGSSPYVAALQEAIGRYVNELRPDYEAVAGGRPRQIYMQMTVGPKWISLWNHKKVRDVMMSAVMYPSDVWKLTEEKLMQVMPWVEKVRITDPEGTDIRFSVTSELAALWPKAYLPNHLFLNPLQSLRDLYFQEGIRRVIVPGANGVVASTTTGSGVYPRMKVYVENGMATRVEGGGTYKRIWDAYLASEKLNNAQVPLFGKKGFFYLYETSVAANPKVIQSSGRSGVFHWGFGAESTIPEVIKYLDQYGLPNDHGMHMITFFTTYEVQLRGRNDWIKLVDRGHLTALDHPEVRALASRYGDPDDILSEAWVPDIPGINIGGDYFEDYGEDPAEYFRRVKTGLEDGRHPFVKE